jgi:ATP-binding cassette subfamily C protein
MIAGAFAEGLGILALVPLLSIVAGSTNGIPILGTAASWLGHTGLFASGLAAFLLVMTSRAWLLQKRDVQTAQLEAAYEAELKLRAMATLAAHGWGRAAQVGQSGIQALNSDEIRRTSSAVHYGLSFVTSGALIFAQLAVAAVLSPFLAAAAAAALLVFVPMTINFAKRSEAAGQTTLAAQEESSRSGFALYAGLKAALAQDTIGGFLDDYRLRLNRVAIQHTGYAGMLARSRTGHSISAALGAVALIAFGYGFLRLDVSRLLAILVLFSRMSGLAQQLQQSAGNFAAFATAFDAVQQRVGPLLSKGSTQSRVDRALDWQTLALERVCFTYPQARRAIGPIDAVFERGEWLAVTGISGAGKSTLIDLVAGLIEPTKGRILVDDVELDSAMLPGWRAGLAYVGQQEWIGEATLRNALGDATPNEIARVLETVGLTATVAGWPQGVETFLADRGARLSGGERQRLLIARALLRNPHLLVLDEATAALDVGAEAHLVRRIRAERHGLAVLMVAHRGETVSLCDKTLSVGA